jgi:CheY-like chemotaxis protein
LFAVEDTGIGIPRDKLGLLFEPFTQASEGYRRTHQGAGLGLSICKRLVGLMGGHIEVDSQEGEGTVVHFCIPFGRATVQSAPIEDKGLIPMPRRADAARILLAEDDLVTQTTVKRLLEKSGYVVKVAGDGGQAIRMLEADEFDVVLMDVQMPVMDGVEAVRRIRRGEAGVANALVPVIALTAYAMAGDREKFLEAGMDEYVGKPVELAVLREIIERVLRSGNATHNLNTGLNQ